MKNSLKITLAESAGFCFGVRDALAVAESLDPKKEDIYILGKLIHNPQVISRLEQKGIKSIDSIDNLDKGTIVISAHGVPDSTIEKARAKGLKIIDTTCPLVKSVHNIGKVMEKRDLQVVIYGEKGHTEVKGTKGNLKKAMVVSSLKEIDDLDRGKDYAVISQTTNNVQDFKAVREKFETDFKNAKVIDTICQPTKVRQSSAIELAKKSDIMIVVGGYISANTRNLAVRCSELTETHHIETADELRKEWFVDKENVGVTAGASTPDYLINDVIEKINGFDKDNKQ